MADQNPSSRSKDRHAEGRTGKYWRPDLSVYSDAMDAVKEIGFDLTAWLNECLKYAVGWRRTFPPRPAWAEARAAKLPPDAD